MTKKIITVFTPTFNRAFILHKLYESLVRQTCNKFEWLIIDDGSTDETAMQAAEWIDKGKITIKYHKQENGGKQRAHNAGVQMCTTELFVCVDSDDYLTYEAIEKITTHWEKVKNDDNIAGIVAMHGLNEKTTLCGTTFPPGLHKTTLLDLYQKHKYKGETLLVYRTNILRQHPFYVAKGENFMWESYAYHQIDRRYTLSLLRRILCIGDYLADGYTRNSRAVIKNNPIGYKVFHRQSFLYATSWWEKYKNSVKYIIGCKLSGTGSFNDSPSKLYTFMAYIPAVLFYWIWFFQKIDEKRSGESYD